MALDQRSERRLGRRAAARCEPFQQLSVGQRPGRPQGEERLELPRYLRSSARHESPLTRTGSNLPAQ